MSDFDRVLEKLDGLQEQIAELKADVAVMSALGERDDEVLGNLATRIDSLETSRDRAKGAIAVAGVGGGALGAFASKVASLFGA